MTPALLLPIATMQLLPASLPQPATPMPEFSFAPFLELASAVDVDPEFDSEPEAPPDDPKEPGTDEQTDELLPFAPVTLFVPPAPRPLTFSLPEATAANQTPPPEIEPAPPPSTQPPHAPIPPDDGEAQLIASMQLTRRPVEREAPRAERQVASELPANDARPAAQLPANQVLQPKLTTAPAPVRADQEKKGSPSSPEPPAPHPPIPAQQPHAAATAPTLTSEAADRLVVVRTPEVPEPRAPIAAADAEPAASAPLNRLEIRVPHESGSHLDLKFTERQGEVRVLFRTDAPAVSRAIQDQLPEITSNLHERGWQAESRLVSLNETRTGDDARGSREQRPAYRSEDFGREPPQHGNQNRRHAAMAWLDQVEDTLDGPGNGRNPGNRRLYDRR